MTRKTSKPQVKTLSDKVREIVSGRGPVVNRTEPEIDMEMSGHVVVESDARTPHNSQWVQICLEIAKKRRNDPLKAYFWTAMANRIKSAQQFQFGTVSDKRIKEEAARAGPLIAGGHLDLPYESVIYNYTLAPDDDLGPEFQHERIKFCTLACRMDPALLSNPLPGPFYIGADFLFAPTEAFHVIRKYAMILTAGVGFQANDLQNKWVGEVIDLPTHKDSPFNLVSVADGIASLSMILATRGIELTRKEPSERVQRSRARKNKNLLPTVTHVNTQKYYHAIENAEKGHHASPVPHLRRGHIRRLGEDRTTWVRDCIVNCRTLDDASKARDHYEVE